MYKRCLKIYESVLRSERPLLYHDPSCTFGHHITSLALILINQKVAGLSLMSDS